MLILLYAEDVLNEAELTTGNGVDGLQGIIHTIAKVR